MSLIYRPDICFRSSALLLRLRRSPPSIQRGNLGDSFYWLTALYMCARRTGIPRFLWLLHNYKSHTLGHKRKTKRAPAMHVYGSFNLKQKCAEKRQ